jgi:NAD(P)H dehydrogenase (quinone)
MIAITGATGNLGNLVIEHLLNKGVDPKSIIAVVRNKNKAEKLTQLGLVVREGDYNNKESLQTALSGVEKLLLISSSEVGQRISQHQNVLEAAKESKVPFIAYTSILKADTSKMQLAREHVETENMIKNSNIKYAILRNSWYIENYTEQLKNYLQFGAIVGSTQNAKLSPATRSDYALAAATVLIQTPNENKIYELAGKSITLTELAETISQKFDKNVVYHDMPEQNYKEMLVGVGLPLPLAQVLADSDVGIARGELFSDKNDLEILLGRPANTIAQVLV